MATILTLPTLLWRVDNSYQTSTKKGTPSVAANPYERRVSKQYQHRVKGDTRTVYGTFRFENWNLTEMAMRQRQVQTTDPRIEWDEDFTEGDGWDYVDFSLQWESDDAGDE
jgi:hypothetical protein